MGKSKRNHHEISFHPHMQKEADLCMRKLPIQKPFSIEEIQKRIKVFESYSMKRQVWLRTPQEVSKIPAISMDDEYSGARAMHEVREVGPLLSGEEELEEARTFFSKQAYIPDIWQQYLDNGKHPPFLFKESSFINLFNKETAIILDIYRPPWKAYFTSDVFLHQYLKVHKTTKQLIDLPTCFPAVLYLSNIAHHLSKYRFKIFLDKLGRDSHVCEFSDITQNYLLSSTPHIKCVWRILQAFNSINSLKNIPQFQIDTLKIYRKRNTYNLRFHIKPSS